MKKKELYEAPSVETYDLVSEGVICDSLTKGTAGQADEINNIQSETPNGLL